MDTVPGKSAFRLLALPAELRALVFQHSLLRQTQSMRICSICSIARPVERKLHPVDHVEPHFLALLLVCKQLYQEAMSIFYGHNKVPAARSEPLAFSLRAIGSKRRANIRNLKCAIGLTHFSLPCLKYLETCAALRHLEIQAFSTSLDQQKNAGTFDHLHVYGRGFVVQYGEIHIVSRSEARRAAFEGERDVAGGRRVL